MTKIYDIDFSCPHDDFMNGFNSYLSNIGNGNISASSTETATKNGKYVYRIEVENKDTSNKTTLIFEKNPNNADILFAPIGMQSFGGTFYRIENLNQVDEDTEEDSLHATCEYLEQVAKNRKGKLVYKTGYHVSCIINGNQKTAKECIVDSNGGVYGAKDVSKVDITGTGSSTHVSFSISLGEWNKQRKLEDPDFAAALTDSQTSTTDKMNYIGKYVVSLKAKEEIEATEFRDIFIQAGLMTSGFSTDKTLNMIYKLLN